MALVTLPRQLVVDANGTPRVGAKLCVYDAGTTTPHPAYTTPSLSISHSSPILSVSTGLFPAVYVDPDDGDYKLVCLDADDVTLWSEDNIHPDGITQSIIGEALYPRTAAEIAASVTPVNYVYPPGHVERYSTNTTPGTTDMSAAFLAAFKSGETVIGRNTSYRINSSVSYTGKVVIDMPLSTIYSDVTTFIITDGTGSRIRALNLLPITTPTTILRDYTNWTNAAGDVEVSFEGYMPSLLDTDIWAGLSAGVQGQLTQIHPGIYFKVSSASGGSDVDITGVTGKCISIVLEGYVDSTVHGNNFTGNGNTYAAVVLFNGVSVDVSSVALGFTLPRGKNNKVIHNVIKYATLSGVTIFGHDDFEVGGNDVSFCGESGIKTYQYDTVAGPSATTACISANGRVTGNKSYQNYHDGIDIQSYYGAASFAYFYRGITISGNKSFRNRHTGITADNAGLNINNNNILENGTHGISFIGWDSTVVGNQCQSNTLTGTSLVAQPFDIFLEGDGIVSIGNVVKNDAQAATYNYFHAGFLGAPPSPGKEGLDFANYCSDGSAVLYVEPSIPASQEGALLQKRIRTSEHLAVSPVRVISGTTYTVVDSDSAVSIGASGTCTVTLPSAVSFPGRKLNFRTTEAQAVISASSNVVPLVGGAASTAILAATDGKWAELQSDGTNWHVMMAN